MQAPDKNKMSSVENALNQIHRQFGKGSIMRLGSQEAELVPVIPTGALSLDIAQVYVSKSEVHTRTAVPVPVGVRTRRPCVNAMIGAGRW